VLFPTVEFAIFFAVVFVVSWLLRPRPTAWKLFSLAASYFFYAWWDWGFLWLLALLTVGNQVFGAGAHRAATDRSRKVWVTTGVVFNLAILGWFKYYGFFVENLSSLLTSVGLDWTPPLVTVVLPIGISFIVFQAISYVVDCSRHTIRPARLLDFGVYLTYFPHILAGPLVRASEFIPQLHEPADPRRIDSSRAFRLIVQGMFKKVVVSSFLASAIVDPVFAAPQSHSSLEVLVAVYAYAIVIYCDFSGYTDIAIGIALLLGIRFPQNFDSPYAALSIQDFWRRWHMTLSRWLRDYLYIGLGGNRYGRLRTYRNLFLTMLIGGFWHGADWTFVIWGAIHGTALVVERYRTERRADAGLEPPPLTPARAVGQWLVTFNVVCLAWVFFRSSSLEVALQMLRQLVVAWGQASPLVTPLVLVTIVAMLASQFVPERYPERVQLAFSRAAPAVQGLVLAGCFFLIDALGPTGVAPFIYFQF
jgi:D-alanyl-lipoteichoic acid acyltransferase DltB (MBOAT superfamily)